MAQITTFPQQDRIRVLAVDNTSMNTQLLVDTLARDGQFHMASSVSTPAEILACMKAVRPQVALISARHGDNASAGFDLCREICATSPSTRVIMLLDASERSQVIAAFRAGAGGVFCRTEPLNLLAKCIRCVHQGQVWASSEELHYLLQAMTEPTPIRFHTIDGKSLLSAREIEVVRCVAEGLTNREIANRLTLTEHTVKNYLFRIFDKLGVSSRVEVVLYALGNGNNSASQSLSARSKKPNLVPVIGRREPSLRAVTH